MSRRGGVAFAFADAEDEDEWTSDNEAALQSMVLAEGSAGVVVEFSSKIVNRSLAPLSHTPRLPLFAVEGAGQRVKFKQALMVTLEEADEGVLLGSPELRMWGSGANAFAALRDFADTFVRVLRDYEATPRERLTQDAAEYLHSLQSLVASREAI
jgi:hypothetical protein